MSIIENTMAEKALEFAKNFGANEAEIYLSNARSISIDIKKDKIDSAKEQSFKGIGIRAIVDGAIGFASTNSDCMNDIQNAAKIAVSSARVRGGDPAWTGLPSKSQFPKILGLFDKKIKEIELDKTIELAFSMLEGSKSVSDILATSGSFSCSYGSSLLINSNGVFVEQEGSMATGFIDVITTKGDVVTSYDFDMSRNLNIDYYSIGKNAATLAKQSQNRTSIESCKTSVILHPFAFSNLLEYTFIPSLSADNVQKNKSSLSEKKGEVIASENLNIIDTGIMESGIGSSISDGEGTPSMCNSIIEKGVFKSFLYDCYTAGKESIKSTGNSSRGSYTSTPSIDIQNMIIEYPGCDIVAETNNGILVHTVIGAHTANSISGDFSVEARNAFLIKDGCIDKPIKSLMISGNIFDVLKNIDGAGIDARSVGKIITPSIRVANMNVSG